MDSSTATLFDDYIDNIFKSQPELAGLPYEHLYKLSVSFFDYKITITAGTALKLFDFFFFKDEGLNDAKFKRKIMDLTFRHFSEFQYCDCSVCDELPRKLILTLITDANLAFIDEKYLYFAGNLFSKLRKRHSSLFFEKLSETSSGLTLWRDTIESKLPVIEKTSQLLLLLNCKNETYSTAKLVKIKYNAMLGLRPILENPENIYIAKAISSRTAAVLAEFSDTCRNAEDSSHEMALCLCFDAVRLCINFDPQDCKDFALPYNLIYYSNYILKLESLNKAKT